MTDPPNFWQKRVTSSLHQQLPNKDRSVQGKLDTNDAASVRTGLQGPSGKPMQTASYVPAKSILGGSVVGSVTSYTSLGRTNTYARDHKLGDVIYVPHVIPSLDPTARLGQNHVGYITNTGPVAGKSRPAVIVAKYANSLTCLPLWTSQGKGLHPAEEYHCVWVRDWTCTESLWDTVDASNQIMMQPPTSAVTNCYLNLTMPYHVSYRYPLNYLGALTPQSFRRLRQLWLINIKVGTVPVDQQASMLRTEYKAMQAVNEFNDVRKAELERQEKTAGTKRPFVQVNGSQASQPVDRGRSSNRR